MGQTLTWIIPRTNRFKFVQIKSLGSQMESCPKGTYFHFGLFRKILLCFVFNMLSGERIKAHWASCLKMFLIPKK